MGDRPAILGGTPAMPEGIVRTQWPRLSEPELAELCRVLREEQLFQMRLRLHIWNSCGRDG